MNILFELLYNLSILVSISIISGFIGYKGSKDWSRAFLQGILMGLAAVIGMIHPFVVAPGLIFDGRSVIISLTGLYFGPIAALIAGIMALMFRISQGGTGVITGSLVIITSATIGVLINIRNKQKNIEITIRLLLFMGIIVHVIMVLLMFTLPDGKGVSTIKYIGLPILLIYPIATVLIGKILSEANQRRKIVEQLRESQTNLTISNEKYRLLTEQVSDVISVLNITKGKFTYISPAMFYLRGLTSEEAMNESLEESVTPESLVVIREAIAKTLKDFTENPKAPNYYIYEIQQPCKNGDIIWVELSIKYRYNAEGDIETVGVSRNIEKRKKSEQKVLYLSYHDQLTGLYNRRFYEEEIKRLDTERNLPLTLLMGDVNGLKLINDSFGHVMGDELLKKVAEVLKKGCRSCDIIARLGGDEFFILLPKTDGDETRQIIKNITDLLLSEKVGDLGISISFGYETKSDKKEDIQDIFKSAEDHMYKKKLFESPSMRGKTIKAIINTLHEKNKREEQHSYRVSALCKSMGEVLGLLEHENEELKSVGLLHDIGKIAIDENILNKPGKLTEDEWKEIKRHPEIGYRILSTVNDMSQMAEYVLAHHERWDGNGYPKGLKGEEIPLVSRIISIVDSYDAMTSERSYRGALPEIVAISELQKNAGVQFDPKLVGVFIEKVLGKISG